MIIFKPSLKQVSNKENLEKESVFVVARKVSTVISVDTKINQRVNGHLQKQHIMFLQQLKQIQQKQAR